MKRASFLIASLAIPAIMTAAIAAPGPQKSDLNSGPSIAAPGGTVAGSATLFAVINSNGTVARSDGHQSAARLGVGTYEVIFRRNITACVFVGTVGLSAFSGSSAPGEITVVGRAGNANGVFVQTFDSNGILADRGFHLFVNC